MCSIKDGYSLAKVSAAWPRGVTSLCCLGAPSTMWSSCDCINLWELISCSQEWEREWGMGASESGEGEVELRFQCHWTKSAQMNLPVCVCTLKSSVFASIYRLVLKSRTEILHVIFHWTVRQTKAKPTHHRFRSDCWVKHLHVLVQKTNSKQCLT